MKNGLLIFDGRHLLWRTSDAFSDLCVEINDEVIGTGGVYGFLSVASRIHQKYKGKVIVAWEGRNNFRYKLYPSYKKREEPTPERLELIKDMKEQEQRIKLLLRSMGVDQYYGVGCEADDVIGRLCKDNRKKNIVVYSGDSDLHQLANKKGTTIIAAPGYRGRPDKVYDYNAVEEKHEVKAEMIPDLKALAGDSSDTIPGIKGIGQKTAASLINEYGDIEKIIESAENKTWEKFERFRKTIAESKEELRLFKKLTTIKTNAKIKRIKTKRKQKDVVKQLMIYRFSSLLIASELKLLMKMGK